MELITVILSFIGLILCYFSENIFDFLEKKHVIKSATKPFYKKRFSCCWNKYHCEY